MTTAVVAFPAAAGLLLAERKLLQARLKNAGACRPAAALAVGSEATRGIVIGTRS